MKTDDIIEPYSFKAGGILFLGFLFGQIIIAFLAVFCTMILRVDYQSSSYFNLIGYVFSLGAPILFYDFFVLKPKSKRLNFNFSTKPVSVYLMIFPMMFGMMLIGEYIVSFIPTTGYFFGEAYQKFMDQMRSLALDNVSMIILTVILAPILEEVLFRGILQKSLMKNGTQPILAIVIASFVFGAIHVYPWQFVGGFMLSMVMGLVYHKTKSLLMPILLHAFNNLISALLIIFVGQEGLHSFIGLTPVLGFLLGLIIFGISFYMFVFRKAIIFGE